MRVLRRAAPAVGALLLVGASLLAPATAVLASETDGAGQDVPVAGTFSFHRFQVDASEEAVGVVHAVRRVPGGTMLYYSFGLREGSRSTSTFAGMFPLNGLGDAYRPTDAARVVVADPAGLRAYVPVVGPDGCFCPSVHDFEGESGVLNTGYAFLPPLPPEVQTVDVTVGFGAVASVPVQEGALEPVSDRHAQQDEPLPDLGGGWQRPPDPGEFAGIDMQRFMRDLLQVSGDLDQQVTRKETPRQVEVGLFADVLFALESAQLTTPARGQLADVAADIAARGHGEVAVVGHTDDSGSPAYNLDLSRRRAQAVLEALQEGAGEQVSLRGEGRGETDPAAENTTEAGRQLNRRVSVSYSVHQ